MPTKKVTALAAAGLLFATSAAVAQTAPRSLPNFATSAVLLQSADVEDEDLREGAPYTGPLILLSILAVTLLVASAGGGDDEETVSPN